MGFADLHIHSIYSYDGTSSIPAILKYVAEKTRLNVIAITDHNTMNGVQEALRLAPAYGIEVIPGCEISTAEGHLLALFINSPIPPHLSLIETALRVRVQNGLCVAAHPMARGTSSLSYSAIRQALSYPEVADALVGIEAFNGGLIYTRSYLSVAVAANGLPLAHLGNSDAHMLQMIGHGMTEFPGKAAADLRKALIYGNTKVHEGRGLNGLNVLRSYIPMYTLRKLGWVVWNEQPQAPLKFTRVARAMKITQGQAGKAIQY